MRKFCSVVILSVILPVFVMGANITIYDGSGAGSSFWWYSGSGQGNEVEEVETDSLAGPQWDLQAFEWVDNTLTMQGGYDFVNGEGGFFGGDVFIDVNGDAVYGEDAPSQNWNGNTPLNVTVLEHFGYEYVLDLNYVNGIWDGSYDVMKLDDSSLLSVYYGVNYESNPWRLSEGGTRIGDTATAAVAAIDGTTPFYTASFDMSWLIGEGELTEDGYSTGEEGIIFHYTYACGNDNLMGRVSQLSVPDGGVTVILLGMALMGVGLVNRKIRG